MFRLVGRRRGGGGGAGKGEGAGTGKGVLINGAKGQQISRSVFRSVGRGRGGGRDGEGRGLRSSDLWLAGQFGYILVGSESTANLETLVDLATLVGLGFVGGLEPLVSFAKVDLRLFVGLKSLVRMRPFVDFGPLHSWLIWTISKQAHW